MAATGSRVIVDTSDLVRGIKQLAKELGPHEVMQVCELQARDTASDIRSQVPVVSGTLAGTVDTVSFTDGAGVTYGGGVEYGWINNAYSHAVDDGLEGVEEQFHRRMEDKAEREVRRL